MPRRLASDGATPQPSLDVLALDDEDEKDQAEPDQGQNEPGVACRICPQRPCSRDKRQGAEDARRPDQQLSWPPIGAVGAIVRIDDDSRPTPGLDCEEEKADRKSDLQQAGWILEEIVLSDPPHQVLALLHEDEDPRDAEDERGDDRYALG